MSPRKDSILRSQTRNKAPRFTDIQMQDAESSEDDYRKKRDRNNQAVKKSRVKSRMRTQETMERVHRLKTENDMLEEKIKILSKELGFLKDLFLAHAGTSPGVNLEGVDLEALLSDTSTLIASTDYKDS